MTCPVHCNDPIWMNQSKNYTTPHQMCYSSIISERWHTCVILTGYICKWRSTQLSNVIMPSSFLWNILSCPLQCASTCMSDIWVIDWAVISAWPIIIILDPCQVHQYYTVTQWHETIIIINNKVITIFSHNKSNLRFNVPVFCKAVIHVFSTTRQDCYNWSNLHNLKNSFTLHTSFELT